MAADESLTLVMNAGRLAKQGRQTRKENVIAICMCLSGEPTDRPRDRQPDRPVAWLDSQTRGFDNEHAKLTFIEFPFSHLPSLGLTQASQPASIIITVLRLHSFRIALQMRKKRFSI